MDTGNQTQVSHIKANPLYCHFILYYFIFLLLYTFSTYSVMNLLPFQCEKLNSDNEDLLARVETLQSNVKLLEVQILEVQRAKAVVDKELEAEKLQKEQKIKVKTPL